MSEPFQYIYFWNRMDRKGQRCAVTARGKMNSCRVEFEDGFKAITSRNAIRRASAKPPFPLGLRGSRGNRHDKA